MDLSVYRFVLLTFLLGACSPGGSGEDAANPGAVEEEPEHELHLESQQIQDWGIRIGPIGRTSISVELTLPGALTVNENRTALVGPLVAGQISSLRVDLGDRVGAGQVLVTLNSPEFTRAQTHFLQAFAQAENNCSTNVRLFRGGAGLDQLQHACNLGLTIATAHH